MPADVDPDNPPTSESAVDAFNGVTATTASPDPQSAIHSDTWYANTLTVGGLILAYGVFITAVSSWLLIKGRNSEEVLRLMAVISAVIVSAFLLVVGYDDKQMTPVIGLLGTIVGYLLGKEQGVQVGARQVAADSSEQTRQQE